MLDSLKRVMLTRVSEVKHGVRSQSFLNASTGRKDPISVNWSPVARDLQLEAKTYMRMRLNRGFFWQSNPPKGYFSHTNDCWDGNLLKKKEKKF